MNGRHKEIVKITPDGGFFSITQVDEAYKKMVRSRSLSTDYGYESKDIWAMYYDPEDNFYSIDTLEYINKRMNFTGRDIRIVMPPILLKIIYENHKVYGALTQEKASWVIWRHLNRTIMEKAEYYYHNKTIN